MWRQSLSPGRRLPPRRGCARECRCPCAVKALGQLRSFVSDCTTSPAGLGDPLCFCIQAACSCRLTSWNAEPSPIFALLHHGSTGSASLLDPCTPPEGASAHQRTWRQKMAKTQGAKYRHRLPQLDGRKPLTDSGTETCLIFHEGWNLPKPSSCWKASADEAPCAHISIATFLWRSIAASDLSWRAQLSAPIQIGGQDRRRQ